MFDVFNYRFAEETTAISREALENIFHKYNSMVCLDEDFPLITEDHEIIISKMIAGKSDNEPDISRFEFRLNMDKKEAIHILTRALLITYINIISITDEKARILLEVEQTMINTALYIIRNSTVRRLSTSNTERIRPFKRNPRH